MSFCSQKSWFLELEDFKCLTTKGNGRSVLKTFCLAISKFVPNFISHKYVASCYSLPGLSQEAHLLSSSSQPHLCPLQKGAI